MIFLTGIRINAGGGETSRLEDIDPKSMERVEVLKGAGSDALRDGGVEWRHPSLHKAGS